jgi:hypothetical protein
MIGQANNGNESSTHQLFFKFVKDH